MSIMTMMSDDNKTTHHDALASLQVGATVRVARPNHSKATGRALIATLQEDDTVCVIWEDPAPRCLIGRTKSFVVTPKMDVKSSNHDADEEYTVHRINVKPLLAFEYHTTTSSSTVEDEVDTNDVTVDVWKDRGDQLLRLGDASAACSYYEMALASSSTTTPQVGGTIIVKKGGFAQLAEVDCINQKDVDVTFVNLNDGNGEGDKGEEEEATVKLSDILLVVMNPDPQRLQERILLNVARCLLQLADVDSTSLERSSRYKSSAVLAATLAFTLATFHDYNEKVDQEHSKTRHTALLLRSQAQAQRGKWNHAIADMKQLLKMDPHHKEGGKLLQQLEQQKTKHKIAEKKLAKQMCQWVDRATSTSSADATTTTSVDSTSPVSHSLEVTTAVSTMKTTNPDMSLLKKSSSSTTHTTSPLLFWCKLLLFPIFLSWLVRQTITMLGRNSSNQE